MNRERLTILRNFLQTEVPEDKYHQGGFGFFEEGVLIRACAGGWATQIPAFQAAGLYNDAANISDFLSPAYHGHGTISEQLAQFFDLTSNEGHHIFGQCANDDPYDKTETIRHIDEVLAGRFVKEEANA